MARGDSRIEQLMIPPHDVSAEQAVLGALMLDNESFWRVGALLKAEDFYRRDHQLIYRAVSELAGMDNPMPFDAVTLGGWFEAQGQAEQVAGGAYLVELANGTPSSANIMAYARIVLDLARRRRLVDAGMRITKDGFDQTSGDFETIQARAVASIEACDSRADADGVPLRQAAKEAFEIIKKRFNSDDDLPGLRFGFPLLEEAFGGLQNGCVYGIGARTKMGKSIFLQNVAENVGIEQDIPVGVWSIEMARSQWVNRTLASIGGINHKHIIQPKKLFEEEWDKLVIANDKISKAPITIFDESAVSVERLSAQAMMLKTRGKLRLAVVDYLQLMEEPDDSERRDLAIGHNSWGLKQLAKRLDIPVVFAFQLNRANESGHTVRAPRASDSRESGAIEQDVDGMILLHRPGYYDKRSKGCRVEVALNRHGETGVYKLEEQLHFCRFIHTNLPWSDTQQSDTEDNGLF